MSLRFSLPQEFPDWQIDNQVEDPFNSDDFIQWCIETQGPEPLLEDCNVCGKVIGYSSYLQRPVCWECLAVERVAA